MEQAELVKKLSALGLDEKEAKTYISLLRLGPSPVSVITEKTGLNRSSLYVVLDRLKERGLVSMTGEGGVREYIAAPPERLERTAKERLEKAQLTHQALETLLPEIRALTKHARHKPRMRVFTGTNGLEQAFEETLSNNEKMMRVFSSTKDIFESLPDYLPRYVHERMRRGISMIGIHPDDPEVIKTLEQVPDNLDDLTVIPRDQFSFLSDFSIFDDKVAFMSHKPPLAVAIQCKGMADVMKAVFDLAATEAKRIGFDPRHKQHG